MDLGYDCAILILNSDIGNTVGGWFTLENGHIGFSVKTKKEQNITFA